MPRPRSQAARRAILDAAVALIERDGYGAVTMEAIAREAGVGKQTLYRWWPGKAAVVLEAIGEGARAIAPAASDVPTFIAQSVRGARRNRRLLAGLMAAAQLDDAFARSFRDEFLARRRAILRELLEASGVADPALGAELVFAALWYRILGAGGPLDAAFARALTDAVLGSAASRA